MPLKPGDAVSYSPGDLNYCISKKIGEVLAAALRCALQTDHASGTYNIVAGRADSLFDWHPARREIGYAPKHNWPEIEEVR